MKTALLLQLASFTYLGLILAGFLMPRVVNLADHLRPLPPFIRRLFWVYYAFIGLCLLSFGVGTFAFAHELASGTPLARALCGFLALFWTMRWFAGAFLFDLSPYLTSAWRRAGLLAANLVFAILPPIYAWAAWKGGAP
jgi:hypothetical protein